MRDIGLRAAAHARVRLTGWWDSVVKGVRDRRDTGQNTIEYVGITILVVAIVALLLQTNMGSEIADTFAEKIRSILNSGGGGGGG